ncbi:ComF family protein [Pedobacter agri]|uniref:ComF family protein n=1 Tax=Pedobacter agri TaxID=454586 RepID=UPI0010D05984|nr:hypothetical protein [Pedobacter agri]RYF21088.1 MAG: hypothetical protein EOO42_11215 [Flavobacteriales bacterium]
MEKTDVGILFGSKLGEKLKLCPLYHDIDLIITVPFHLKKYRIRGYNQSLYSAEDILTVIDIEFSESELIRNAATESQTKKSRYNRYEDMQDIFNVVNLEMLNGQHILQIDDIITIGPL